MFLFSLIHCLPAIKRGAVYVRRILSVRLLHVFLACSLLCLSLSHCLSAFSFLGHQSVCAFSGPHAVYLNISNVTQVIHNSLALHWLLHTDYACTAKGHEAIHISNTGKLQHYTASVIIRHRHTYSNICQTHLTTLLSRSISKGYYSCG